MAKETFERALAAVLKHEGGFSDQPADPGGATMKGVTQRVYDGYRRLRGLPTQPVRHIGDVELRDIYRQQYWDRVGGDALPPGVDYVVFDGAVNSGVAQSAKWLQRALGVRADGSIDPETIAACWDVQDHDKLIANICQRRMAYLKALRTWPVFGEGWGRRVEAVQQTGQQWARGSVGAAVLAEGPGVSARANVEDARRLAPTGLGEVAIGGGSVLGGVGAAISASRDWLARLVDGSNWFVVVVVALIVTGAAIVIGGAIWRAHERRKAAEMTDALGYPAAA